MTRTLPASPRYETERGLRIAVQIPEAHLDEVTAAILSVCPLKHGDYDRVTYVTAPGRQRFRSLGTGRNSATAETVEVPCTELAVFLPEDTALARRCIEAIYAAHPYEEPVIHVSDCLRTLHIRGMDEDNPNRFWNRPTQDWIPPDHR